MKKKDFKNDFLKIKQTLEYEGILNALLKGIYNYWSWPDKVYFLTPYCVKKVERLCEKYIESSILSDQRYGRNYALCNNLITNSCKVTYHNIPEKIIPYLNQTITYKINIPLNEVIRDEEPAIKEQFHAKIVDRIAIIKQIQRYRFIYKWGMRSVRTLLFMGAGYVFYRLWRSGVLKKIIDA